MALGVRADEIATAGDTYLWDAAGCAAGHQRGALFSAAVVGDIDLAADGGTGADCLLHVSLSDTGIRAGTKLTQQLVLACNHCHHECHTG
jgi:hypothetical protein